MKTVAEYMVDFDAKYPECDTTIRSRIECEIENLIDNAKYDEDIAERLEDLDFDAIEIHCECDQCERVSRNPENWQHCIVYGNQVVHDECNARICKDAEFDATIEATVAAIESAVWIVCDYNIAQTGTRYYEICREDESGSGDTKVVRVADHCECYCREDYDVSPSGMTPDGLKKILENL